MANLKYRFDNAAVRKLIIKMGKLAEQYQEPYDSHDEKAYTNNAQLKSRWEIYGELLDEFLDDI